MTLLACTKTLFALATFLALGTHLIAGAVERRELGIISEQLQSVAFDRSCAIDGSLDGRGSANCFEKSGYRFVRKGLASIIAAVNEDGSTEVVYRYNSEDDGGSLDSLRAARMALQTDGKEAHDKQL